MIDNEKTIPAKFIPPLKGVFEATAYEAQPEGTTPDTRNMRAVDPVTRRLRLTQRGGPTKSCTAQISGGANAVQLLAAAVKVDGRLSYALDTTPDVKWQKVIQGRRDGLCVAVRRGNLYVAAAPSSGTGVNFLAKYNAAGALIWLVPIPLSEAGHLAKSVKIDEDGGIYVAISAYSAPTAIGGHVVKFSEVPDGSAAFLEWTIPAQQALGVFQDVAVKNGVLYALEANATDTWVQKWSDINTAQPRMDWARALGFTNGTNGAFCITTAADGSALVGRASTTGATTKGRIYKIGTNGATIWDTAGLTNENGIGFAVVATADGSIYTHGNAPAATPYTVRKLTDEGGAVTNNAVGLATETPVFRGAKSLAVDLNGVVYQVLQGGGYTYSLYRIKEDFSGYDYRIAASDIAGIYSIDLDDDLVDMGTKVEHFWLGTDASAGSPYYGVQRYSQYTVTSADGSPRTLNKLAVTNGKLFLYDATSATEIVTASAASAGFQSTGRFLAATNWYNRVLFTDGLKYLSYDAITNLISPWAATSAGEIPRRGRLLSTGMASVFVAGFEDQPQQWAKSGLNDPDDFDFFPPAPSATQAILGTASATGICPDIINTMIPLSDDVVAFGCDKGIYLLSGNPAAGGRFDRLPVDVGIAFGMRTWCEDDESGVFYFLSTQGRVYRWAPGSMPESISRAIDKRLRDVNLSTHKVMLAWNFKDLTLHVFVSPYTPGTTTHFVWEKETGGWQIDTFPSSALNPMDVMELDGDDPADRVLLMGDSGGSGGGYVNYWNSDATSDGGTTGSNGTAIPSYVVMGPLQAAGPDMEFGLKGLKAVLANGSSSVSYEVFGAESPDYNIIGAAQISGTWAAGRNSPRWDPSHGQSQWLKVGRYPTPSVGTWGLETAISGLAIVRGRVKNR